MEMPEALTKKVGPFNVGTWMVIGGAGVGVGILIRRSEWGKPKAPATPPAAGDEPSAGYTPPAGGTIPWQPAGQVATPSTPAPGNENFPDNNTWGQVAVAWLITQGVNPTVAYNAVQAFLREQPMTRQLAAVVEMALRQFGAPPFPVAPMNIVDDPPPGGSNPPPPGNLSSIPPAQLIQEANTITASGGNVRPYVVEYVRRLKAGSASINDPALSVSPGVPTEFGYAVVMEALRQGLRPA